MLPERLSDVSLKKKKCYKDFFLNFRVQGEIMMLEKAVKSQCSLFKERNFLL